MISEIKDFYFYYHTTAEIKYNNTSEWILTTSFCKRMDFLNATFDALAFLVHSVALTVFSAVASIVTFGLATRFKACFCKNAYEALVHASSIPISLVGIIFPKVINKDFLKLTPIELKHGIEPGTLKEVAGILGGIIIRKRRPLKL